jgi:hypothetical protein
MYLMKGGFVCRVIFTDGFCPPSHFHRRAFVPFSLDIFGKEGFCPTLGTMVCLFGFLKEA